MSLPQKIDEKLHRVCTEMRQYLNEVKVVSRLELFVKAREALENVGGFSEYESELIIEKYDLRPDQLVVISIMGETPYLLGCPFLHEETHFKSKLFYHSHTFSPSESDLESALLRLRSIRIGQTGSIVERVFSQAGYSSVDEDEMTEIRTYRKRKSNEQLRCIILESVNDAEQLLDKLPPGSVIGVPTEDSPAPFVSFYRKHKGEIKERNLSIIVVNIEDLRTSPFLGYPQDKELISLFDEPDLVARIASVWGEEGDEEQLR